MVVFRRAMLALLLVAASAGCTSASAPDGPATATASPSTPRASSKPPVSASTSPARPSVPSSPSSAPRRMPPVSAQAHAAGLIDIRTIVPDAIVDLRYATSDNFV
ncbi:MAG: zinc D-Ala-D-Ala dipeptidase, partial [Pseudonocardiales bacterium]|nr:zinc D-Ala-D-Ala dipeptidase [Pseudonocardiales bacterium]